MVELIIPLQPPELGQPYTVLCKATPPPESFPAEVTVRWIEPNGVQISSRSAINEVISLPLSFDPLGTLDRGVYTCMVVVTSPNIGSPQIITRLLNLTLPTDPGMLS